MSDPLEGGKRVLWEAIHGHWRLDDERWANHKDNHGDLAEQLRQYKDSANEWRQTFSDARSTFVSNATYDAKHEALAIRISILERAAERTAGSVATWRFLAGGGGVLGLISIALWITQGHTA